MLRPTRKTGPRTRRLFLSFALVLTVGLAACTSTQPTQNTGQNAPAQKLDIGFAAAPTGGAWYPISAGLGDAIEKGIAGSRVTLVQGGGKVNPTMVNKMETELGIANGYAAADALVGRGDYDTPHPNLLSLMTLFEGYYQIAVLPDSPIKSFADLKGKRISAGAAGQSSIIQTELVLKAYGLTLDDMAKVEYVSFTEGAQMLKDGQIDAFSSGTSGAPVSSMEDIATSRGLRLLAIDKEKMEQIYADNPGFIPSAVPAGAYKGQAQPVPTLKTTTSVIVHKDLAEESVYDIMTAIFSRLENIRAIHPLLANFTLETASQDLGTALHPGAERFYKEKGVIK